MSPKLWLSLKLHMTSVLCQLNTRGKIPFVEKSLEKTCESVHKEFSGCTVALPQIRGILKILSFILFFDKGSSCDMLTFHSEKF